MSVEVAWLVPDQYTFAPVMGCSTLEFITCSFTEPEIRCADAEIEKRKNNPPERNFFIQKTMIDKFETTGHVEPDKLEITISDLYQERLDKRAHSSPMKERRKRYYFGIVTRRRKDPFGN